MEDGRLQGLARGRLGGGKTPAVVTDKTNSAVLFIFSTESKTEIQEMILNKKQRAPDNRDDN